MEEYTPIFLALIINQDVPITRVPNCHYVLAGPAIALAKVHNIVPTQVCRQPPQITTENSNWKH